MPLEEFSTVSQLAILYPLATMRVLGLQVLFAAALAGSPLYSVRYIGVPDAASSAAFAISSTGLIAGEARTYRADRLAFHESATGPMTLAVAATAAGVNSAGTVVGTPWTEAGPFATVWQNGAAAFLEITESYATALNERGDVAGSGWNSGRTWAFVHSGGATTFIDAGVWSTASGISNTGQVVGYAEMSSGSMRAFSWTPAGGVQYIGTLGGRHSYGNAVNERGAIVGTSTNASGYLRAFLYNGGMTDLGTFGGTTSAAYDVNGSGHAVGYATDADGQSRAFVWRDGVLYDLNSLIDPASGWTLEAAYGVNDRGQIVGAGMYNGRSTAFALDPMLSMAAALQPELLSENLHGLPEPATWLMLLVGILIIAAARTLRRAH